MFFILGKQETEVVFNFNTDVEIKPESDPNPETKLTTTTWIQFRRVLNIF